MDTLVVMNGYVGGDVESTEGTGFTYAWFSLGCTPRFRAGNGEWRDGETTWITVHCSRALAENVRFSLRKGDPVIVVGRLTTRTFERKDGAGRGSALQVEATGVGHDLNTGTSTYRKSHRTAPKGATPTEVTTEELDNEAGQPEPQVNQPEFQETQPEPDVSQADSVATHPEPEVGEDVEE